MSEEFSQSGTATEVVTQATMSDKSKGIAIILSLFFGALGIHRFYIGRIGSGFVMLALFGLGWLTTGLLVGFFFLVIVCIWDLIDLIRLITGGLTDNEGRKLK